MKILLVDDENLSREMTAKYLEGLLGYQVTQCDNAFDALKEFQNDIYPLVLTDIKMPGMDGVELLKEIKRLPEGANTEVVLFTGFADLDTAVQAIRFGAYDYLFKPVDVERLAEIVIRRFEAMDEKNEETADEDAAASKKGLDYLKKYRLDNGAYFTVAGGEKFGIFSRKMREVVAMALKFHEDRTVPVLIEGESGTGKEVITKIVHHGTGETTRPLISINCSAISPSLFESELFGYEAGAFTGSKSSGMIGKLELAQGGTIFLDEIGDMPLDMQPKLLRFIQDRTIYRVGGLKNTHIDVRIIAATNRNLQKLVSEGTFRQDLYQRLNPGWIHLHPLREQAEAIPPLAQMFLLEFSEKRQKQFRLISKEAVKMLEEYSWPGNIRELRNTVERIVLLYDEIELRPDHLNVLNLNNEQIFKDTGKLILKPGNYQLPEDGLNLRELELEIVEMTLQKFNGNKSKAARYLDLTLSALRSRLKA